MERYLPSKSHVVIRDAAGKTVWYDTRLEIALNDDVQTVQCPIRLQPVQMVTFQGYAIFFLPEQAKYRVSKDETANVAQMELYLLEYDIPTGADMYNDDHPWNHPSQYLWGMGIRTTKSCWVIPKNRIPYSRLNRLTEVGATWSILKADVSETSNLIDSCCKALQREYDQAAQRAREVQERAETAIAEGNASTEQTEEMIKKGQLARVKRLQKATEERFKELEAGAAVFGLNVRALGQQNAQITIKAIEVSMAERARLFAKAVQVAQITGSTAVAVAEAAKTDASVIPILADALQDGGHDQVAETLRSAFSETAVVTDGPAGDDDGTFSLADVGEDAA